jgi:hypothetical protein
VLAEGAWTTGPHRLQYRFEITERPEEERISGFRSLRPHLENSILGITRWTAHTVGYEVAAVRYAALEVRPFAEVEYASIGKVGGGLFDVEQLYGRRHIWSITLGLRVTAGALMHRMGRYGAAEEHGMSMHHHEEMGR